jgi:predicted transcriptional regulator
MAKDESVLDILEHANSLYTYRELVLTLKEVKNQSSVCREIKHLMKMNQITRTEIKVPNSRTVIFYKLNKNNTI